MNNLSIARASLALALAVWFFVQPIPHSTAQPQATIWRVASNGSTELPCGGSWSLTDPNPGLRPCDFQIALDAAASGEQIWVLDGIYNPTRRTDSADPRSATFTLPEGVAIYGGFAGFESSPDQRNLSQFTSHLSGDLDRNDLHRPAQGWEDIQGANAYHVVVATNISAATRFDGFTISGGNASGANNEVGGPTYGGGMIILNSSPTLHFVKFIGNIAKGTGGGIYLSNASNIMLMDVVFWNNTAVYGGGMGISGGNVQVRGAMFYKNILYSNPIRGKGGGLFTSGAGVTTITNATFAGNIVFYGDGDAISAQNHSSITLNHVTLSNFTDFPRTQLFFESGASFSINNSLINEMNVSNIDNGSEIRVKNATGTINNTFMRQRCPETVTCSSIIGYHVTFLGGFNHYLFTGGYGLLSGSLAIDRSITCEDFIPDGAGGIQIIPLTADQRGAVRPNGAGCDLGAFEYAPTRWYVDAAAAGANTGQSWTHAFTDLQSALLRSSPEDEVWVAAGTYYPTQNPRDRSASFVLRSGVAIYGGFAGGETDLSQRNWEANPTILSGDIDRNQPVSTGNSYHVVFNDSLDMTYTSILDGFRVTGGEAYYDGILESEMAAYGGGIFNQDGWPVLRNLIINHNEAVDGAGIHNARGIPLLYNVIIHNNKASKRGGGITNSSQYQAVMANVTLTRNYAAEYGGAILSVFANQQDYYHVTIYDNHAGIDGGGILAVDSDHTLFNSIVWGNTPNQYNDYYDVSTFVLQRSILQGECPVSGTCTFVIDQDPVLGTLGSAAGSPYTLPLLLGSPAIDAVPESECVYFDINTFIEYWPNSGIIPLTFDQRGAPRPTGAACDIGAHEHQPSITILSGDLQRTEAFSPFPSPLVVGALDAYGQPVDGLAVTFTVGDSDAGGSVSQSTVPMTQGQAAVNAAAQFAAGVRVLAAAPGYDPAIFQLAVNDTKVALSVEPNPALFGQPVTLRAQVAGQLPGAVPAPSGSVTFKNGDQTLGTVNLQPADPSSPASAQAEISLSNLAVGTHTLTASYSGDQLYHDQTSSPVQVTNITSGYATLGLSGLAQTYNGQARTVTVSTTPPNLAVRVTYEGLPEPPVQAGSYAVYAEVIDPNYTGSASGTLVIAKAQATVTLSGLNGVYNGLPQPVTVTTNPPGLAVNVTYTSQPAEAQPGSAGLNRSPSVAPSPDDHHIAGLSAEKEPACSAPFANEPTAPALAGIYQVDAIIVNNNYHGTAKNTLQIDPAPLRLVMEPASRSFGVPNPAPHYHFEGFVNGENESVINGSPTPGPLPSLDAPPGAYPVSFQLGSLKAANYRFIIIPGELTIHKAHTQLMLLVSSSPARPGQPFLVEALVFSEQGELPAGVTIGGSVAFSVNGGPPVLVPLAADGKAQFPIDALPPGEYVIDVQYQGDINFEGASAEPLQVLIAGLRLFLPLVIK